MLITHILDLGQHAITIQIDYINIGPRYLISHGKRSYHPKSGSPKIDEILHVIILHKSNQQWYLKSFRSIIIMEFIKWLS
jgi:hypothetical protein